VCVSSVNRRGITSERKSHVIGNDLLPHVPHLALYRPVSRVEEAREEPMEDRYLSIPDRVSATINTRPVLRLSALGVSESSVHEYPLMRCVNQTDRDRLIVQPRESIAENNSRCLALDSVIFVFPGFFFFFFSTRALFRSISPHLFVIIPAKKPTSGEPEID